MTTIHVPGPFGGCNEQDENEAFEWLVGGPDRGFRLMRIMTEPGRDKKTALAIAEREGYTKDQIRAWEHL